MATAQTPGAHPAVAAPTGPDEALPPDGRWWELLPFTTHRIALGEDLWTTERGVVPEIDLRVRTVVDACGGSLAGKTVVDLGCLEGGFTLAFARLGAAEAVGIEARALSHRRCELARRLLRLPNARFVHGDVKDELAHATAGFDVVFAAGILYHVADPWTLLRAMADACRDVALVDTHVAGIEGPSHAACSAEIVERAFGKSTWRGRNFREYAPASDANSREQMIWSAWSDAESFWPLEADLVSMIRDAGFARATKIAPDPALADASWQVDQTSRVLYLCSKR
jgi:2-polyprenyl-3-methyl-5-hydroxy-6-metoxy-1,4-benzoquinol methylase